MSEQIGELLGGYVPRFLGAIAILIVGWFAALFLQRLTTSAVEKTDLTSNVRRWFGQTEDVESLKLAVWMGQVVFYTILAFVLVAFFQTLGLTTITQPITNFLNQVFEYAPRLIGPAVLLLVAWLTASVLRVAVKRVLHKSKLDQRIESEAGLEKETRAPVSETLGDSVYWLTFLIFLPAILGGLDLGGLLEPVQSMVDKVLGFLPNVLAAGVILVVGWLVARILQRLVANLLAAAGADRLSKTVGLEKALGKTRLSALVGLVIYVLILIPVLVASLNSLKLEAITRPASEMLNAILIAIPSIFAAVLVLVIAYLVGRVVAGMVTNVLGAVGFDTILVRLEIGKKPKRGERTPSQLVGYLLVVTIMLFAAIEALALVRFESLAALVSEFLVFAGQVLLGLVIFAIGLYLANLAAKAIKESKIAQAEVLTIAARMAILVLAGAIGLRQMGLANEIITVGFGLLFGTVAVAAAVAFGIGGRDFATRMIEEWDSSLRKAPAAKKRPRKKKK